MIPALLARIVSIMVVCVFVFKCPTQNMVAATFSVSIAHYFLSYFYSYRQIRLALSQPRSGMLFGTLTIAAWRMIAINFPLWAIFSFHHAFNETYTADATTSGERSKFLTTPRLVSAFAIYLIIQYRIVLPFYNFQNWMIAIITAASLAITVLIISKRLYSNALDLLCLISFEILSFWPLVVCREQGLALWEIALFHVTFWVTYPLIGMAKKNVTTALKYFAFHIVMIAAIWHILPLGHFHLLTWAQAMWTFSCLTVLHILHSLSTSDAQPTLLRRLFRPMPANLARSSSMSFDGTNSIKEKELIQTK